ncbi:MAG: glutamyl-tRNA reductase [Deltaproteobacteria bacterium]|nr:glutamyl-tRNA reductase [Deltaproteobacteria bacterium]
MQLFVTGLSHKTAPIEVRERLAFSGDALALGLGALRKLPDVREAVMVCTCNRTEIYGLSGSPEEAAAQVSDWMGDHSAADLSAHLYGHTGRDALVHLFRVASSLDSMVVGEPQILGQVKKSFSEAQLHRAAGPRLERIFSRAFQCAKKVRSETGIGESAVSMSFVAVELARKIFQDLVGRKVLLVGAGEMCELAAAHMMQNGASEVVVANRSHENALALAERFDGEAASLSEVERLLGEVDIVLSSTAAPGYLVTKEQMARAVKARRYRPILVIDLAVPRDIDPGVNSLSNVYAYDVDDMQKVVEDNLRQRSDEANRGERMVRLEVAAFLEQERGRAVLPVVAAFRHTADRIAREQAEKTLAYLEREELSDEGRARIEALAHAVVKQVLHQPTVLLRSSASTDDGEQLAATLVKLFGLDVQKINDEITEEKARRREERLAALQAEAAEAKVTEKKPSRILPPSPPAGDERPAAQEEGIAKVLPLRPTGNDRGEE